MFAWNPNQSGMMNQGMDVQAMAKPAMWDQQAADARRQAMGQFNGMQGGMWNSAGLPMNNPMAGAMGPMGQAAEPMMQPRPFNPVDPMPQSMGNIPVGNQTDQSPMAQQNAQQQYLQNKQMMMQKQQMMQRRQGPGSRIIRTDQKQAPMGQQQPMAQQQNQIAANRQQMMQKPQGPGSRFVY